MCGPRFSASPKARAVRCCNRRAGASRNTLRTYSSSKRPARMSGGGQIRSRQTLRRRAPYRCRDQARPHGNRPGGRAVGTRASGARLSSACEVSWGSRSGTHLACSPTHDSETLHLDCRRRGYRAVAVERIATERAGVGKIYRPPGRPHRRRSRVFAPSTRPLSTFRLEI
jgi:hypothetical protein